MNPSILCTVFVLLTTYSLISHAQNQDCTCGGLGQGSNPCTCSEMVVKAAELPKPTYYVPAQEIKDAVTAKNTIVISADTSQSGCSNSQSTNTAIIYSDSNSSPCSNSNTCGCSGSNSDSNAQSESTIVYTDSNSPDSSGSSIVYKTDASYSDNSNQPSCGCNKQNIETLEIEDTTNLDGNIVPKFSPIGDLCYPLPLESSTGKIIEKSTVTPAYPGKLVCCPPSVPYEICINTATGDTKSTIITSSSLDAPSKTTYETITTAAENNGVITGVASGSLSTSNTDSYTTLTESNSGMYSLPLVYAKFNNGNRQQQYPKTVISSSSSDCFGDSTGEAQVDYSYPTVPADAVSLTLAYKNLRAPNVIYRQGKQFIPEDKLSFGHRTVPAEVNSESQIPDIPEEKLVTVNKPIVELKLAPPKTVVIGSYDEQEEAKLAELEAFERESITQEESVDQSLITYKDLGYAPIGVSYAGSMSYNQEIDDSAEQPCGPLGPSVPGYIPGTVVVQKQLITDGLSNSDITGFSETMEIQTSGSNSCPSK